MLRALLALLVISSVGARDTANCAINGARAVDDMLDSAVYIMASMARCDHVDQDHGIRCALDVSSAIEAVNKMVNVIVKAVEDCGGLKEKHHKCGMAVGVLTRSVAGLSAATAGVIAKCPNALNNFHALETVGSKMEAASRYGGHRPYNTAGFSPAFGQCVINIKDAVKSLFKAIKRVMTVKENCADPQSKHCMHNSAKIVAAFTNLAAYISGTVGKCTADPKHTANALCAEFSIKLFNALDNVDRAGVAMASSCHISEAERLYLDNEVNEEDYETSASSSGSMTLTLAALLPITAVLSFVGGKRLAQARSQPAADFELLQVE